LARHFLDRVTASIGRDRATLSPEAEDVLRRYPWPGNIRELRNVLERALLLANESVLSPKELGLNNQQPRPRISSVDTNLTLGEMERFHIQAVLGEERGNIDRAARRLGIHRSSLYHKIKRYNLLLHRA
jgi:DNA-binding NtrC family response regulator